MTLPRRTLLALEIIVRNLVAARGLAVVEPAAPVRKTLLPVGLALGAVGGGDSGLRNGVSLGGDDLGVLDHGTSGIVELDC